MLGHNNSRALFPTRWITLFVVSIGLGVHNAPAQTESEPTQTKAQSNKSQTAKAESKSPTVESSAKTDGQKVNQTEVVRKIYEATKTAKTAKQLSEFLDRCDDALSMELSKENRDYVVSLTGWALNRRGIKRFELAKRLKQIQNVSQFEKAFTEAMDDFDRAIIADSERYRSFMSRGIAHAFAKDYRLAAIDFTSAMKLKPDLTSAWFNRAESIYAMGKYAAAISDYEVALRFDPQDVQSLTGRGHARFALNLYEKALEDFEQVLEIQPNDPSALLNRGDALQVLGKWEQAIADYKKARSLKETTAACQRSAWLLATCPDKTIRDADAAIKLANRAIKLGGETVTNLDTLAAASAAQGNFEQAASTQKTAIGLATAQVDADAEPYQARLAKYEQGEPYVQPAKPEENPAKDAQKPEPDQQTSSTAQQ